MSNSLAARISIGGPLRREIVDQFIEAIEFDVSTECGYASPQEIREGIESAVAAGTTFDLFEMEARNGEFDKIESFCRNHELTYKRHNEAKYEFDDEISWWTPGMQSPESAICDNAGGTLVSTAEILKCMEGDSSHLTKLASIAYLIGTKTPIDVPPLRSLNP